VYGSLEAARHLRHRTGKFAGAIVNVGSEASDRALPVLGMYSASKHAVKGFTDALRMELEKEKAPVVVTLVKPGATNTPFPEHAKNYLDREPTLPPPVYAPQIAASAILHCAVHPERDLFAGTSAKIHSLEETFLPRMTDFVMQGSLFDKTKSDQVRGRFGQPLGIGSVKTARSFFRRSNGNNERLTFHSNTSLLELATRTQLGVGQVSPRGWSLLRLRDDCQRDDDRDRNQR
jgi:hypothetical protein